MDTKKPKQMENAKIYPRKTTLELSQSDMNTQQKLPSAGLFQTLEENRRGSQVERCRNKCPNTTCSGVCNLCKHHLADHGCYVCKTRWSRTNCECC